MLYITYKEAFNCLGRKIFGESWNNRELESYIYKNLYYADEILELSKHYYYDNTKHKYTNTISNVIVEQIRDKVVKYLTINDSKVDIIGQYTTISEKCIKELNNKVNFGIKEEKLRSIKEKTKHELEELNKIEELRVKINETEDCEEKASLNQEYCRLQEEEPTEKYALTLFEELARSQEYSVLEILYLSGVVKKLGDGSARDSYRLRLEDLLRLLDKLPIDLELHAREAYKTIKEIIRYHFTRRYLSHAMGISVDETCKDKCNFIIKYKNKGGNSALDIRPLISGILDDEEIKEPKEEIVYQKYKSDFVVFPNDEYCREQKIDYLYLNKKAYKDTINCIKLPMVFYFPLLEFLKSNKESSNIVEAYNENFYDYYIEKYKSKYQDTSSLLPPDLSHETKQSKIIKTFVNLKKGDNKNVYPFLELLEEVSVTQEFRSICNKPIDELLVKKDKQTMLESSIIKCINKSYKEFYKKYSHTYKNISKNELAESNKKLAIIALLPI